MKRLQPAPWRSLLLAAVALATAAFPASFSALSLNRDAILRGELWRLWTGHWVHGSNYHLMWNLVPLVGLGLLFERTLKQRLWTLFLLGAPMISAGVLFLQPDLPEYRGLSGFLNTLFVAGALRSAAEERIRGNRAMEMIYIGSVIGSFVKIVFEAWGGAPLFTEINRLGGVPVPAAHFLGGLVGLLGLLGKYSFVQPRSVDLPETREKGRLPI